MRKDLRKARARVISSIFCIKKKKGRYGTFGCIRKKKSGTPELGFTSRVTTTYFKLILLAAGQRSRCSGEVSGERWRVSTVCATQVANGGPRQSRRDVSERSVPLGNFDHRRGDKSCRHVLKGPPPRLDVYLSPKSPAVIRLNVILRCPRISVFIWPPLLKTLTSLVMSLPIVTSQGQILPGVP